jgi:hypothetical protein
MQSATSIQFISDRAKNTFDQGGERTALTVDFRVFKRGPAHVAGIIFSPDFWGSRNEALATFQRFEGDFEVWKTVVSGARPQRKNRVRNFLRRFPWHRHSSQTLPYKRW